MSESFYNLNAEKDALINLVTSQFVARTQIESNNSGANFMNAVMNVNLKEDVLWFTITTNDEAHNITVPLPFVEDGTLFIRSNGIKRAVCNYYDVMTEREMSYLTAIQTIFIGDFSNFINTVVSKRTMFVQRLAHAVLNKNLSIIVYSLQKAINELVNNMPLHETTMNSWMMNKRLMLIDPAFDIIEEPDEKLEYQVNKNRKYFERGWTSIGLSDGTLASKNYILKSDLRNYTPFGKYHHNPQRNLYSTLGMKGDEFPIVRSASMNELMNVGIARKGWNLFTVFADIPDTFEDQIVVDNRHRAKFTTKELRIQCFGEMVVKEGAHLKRGQVISISPDGDKKSFNVHAEETVVKSIIETTVAVGGIDKEVNEMVVVIKRNLKDATKFTNMHGNKGVIHFEDLGKAINEKTGIETPIDVIVSAKTIGKRKNHGQLLELLFNNMLEFKCANTINMAGPSNISKWTEDGVGVISKTTVCKVTKIPAPLIIADNRIVTEEELVAIEKEHVAHGYKSDARLACETYAGNFDAVCGKVFWGVIKDPEDQLWDNGATTVLNGKGLRTAGLKFSSIEFRAMGTVFGENSAVEEEVLSYVQGIDIVKETIEVLRSKKGIVSEKKPVIDPLTVKVVDQSNGTLFTEEALACTIADEFFYTDGCVLQLPVIFQTAVSCSKVPTYEGMLAFTQENLDRETFSALYDTDKLFVPAGMMRKSWKHDSGMFGMSEPAVLLNNIILFCKRMASEPEEPRHRSMLYSAIQKYYTSMALSLSTKKGSISTQAMSVRYPYSAKAVASLSTKIPANTVQIHSEMADQLKLVEGDVVIVERFPCLGFMGVRAQLVTITDDPMCRFTIRASNNSLVSTNLDFDGDVIYIAAFHTQEAKNALYKEIITPHTSYYGYVDQLNNRKGSPFIHSMGLTDFGIKPFPDFTSESHAQVVGKLTGIKAQTGPVIAMTYNIMRIMESSKNKITREMRAGIEMFVEKAGQSVFEQKHGGQSLHDIVIKAICTADVAALVAEGFDENVTKYICNKIKESAVNLNVHDLVDYCNKRGTTIVSRIVRTFNKVYFASRSFHEGCSLLDALEYDKVDLPSKTFKTTMSGIYTKRRTILDRDYDNSLISLVGDEFKNVCSSLFLCIDKLTGIKRKQCKIERTDLLQLVSTHSCTIGV